jgi:hypothetical protein
VKPQKPAEGILLVNDWGTSKMYKAVCQCGDDEHTHTIDIETDDSVNVTIYTTVRTAFWDRSRWHYIWQLLTTGSAKFENTLVMNEQQALTYAETIKQAVTDVQSFNKS